MIAHYTTDRHRPNKERTAAWRILWVRRHKDEDEREAMHRAGCAAKDRIVGHMRERERMVRVPPAHWQRVAAGLAHALALAEPLLARRVVSIRRRA
jgi:hypothetical protein